MMNRTTARLAVTVAGVGALTGRLNHALRRGRDGAVTSSRPRGPGPITL